MSTAKAFVMRGAREAIAGGMVHMEEQVAATELSVSENPGLAFDLARTLVESTCKNILSERGIEFSSGDDLPKLFKLTTHNLRFLPEPASAESGARKSLLQTLNGMHTVVRGLCELRNSHGFASHGAAEARASMEDPQALLAVEAADVIIGFLCRVHQRDYMSMSSYVAGYNDNVAFNERVDDAHELVRIYEVEYLPSEVLFRVDVDAYRAYKNDFEDEPAIPEESPEPSSGGGVGS